MIENKLKQLISIPIRVIYDKQLSNDEKMELIRLYSLKYEHCENVDFMDKLIKLGYASYDKYGDIYELDGV